MRRRRLGDTARLTVYSKTDGHCAYCGCEIAFNEMQIDHAVSLHNHGADEISNMLPSCSACNYYKRGSNVDGFRRKLKRAFRKDGKCEFVKELEQKYDGWDGIFYFER